MERLYYNLLLLSFGLILCLGNPAIAQNTDVDVYQQHYLREPITGVGWRRVEIGGSAPLIANDRGRCPIRHDGWDRKNESLSIINLTNSACIYRGGEFEARQNESLEFQSHLDTNRQYVWTVEEIGRRFVVRLLSHRKTDAFELPAAPSAWQIVSSVGDREAETLLLRRRDGLAMRAISHTSVGFEVYDKSISGSQYASLISVNEVNFLDLCADHDANHHSLEACSVNDIADQEKVYQIGDCDTNRTPVVYVHGGPFAPALPQLELERVRRLLTGTDARTLRPCLMIPRLATSSDSFTDRSFETAISRANRQVREIALSTRRQHPSIENVANRHLVITESFGSQSLADLIETNQSLDVIFFSALLDEVKFAKNFGAIIERPAEANISENDFSQLQEDATNFMRRQVERPSFWRVKQYITWLSRRRKPILLLACERSAPTRIVVVRSADDPRGTINPEVEKEVISACFRNGHELEFATSQTGGHATGELATFAFNNSQLLRQISRDYRRQQ